MDKLKMHTPNKADENFVKLAAMFPNAVTETIDEATGQVVRAIDADVLRQEISTTVVEGRQERYQFTWPDKKKSVVLANAPTNKTLRLDREKSVGRDGKRGSVDTENIYIEGDNLDALKILRETYLGKIKMIYIDPPYNTGSDFIYEDDFPQNRGDYLADSGQFDEYGDRIVSNLESNGRFHTDWLNMIYPRLKLVKDLLTDDGVIFISIDDNEVENLKKGCNEILGQDNHLGTITWRRFNSQANVGLFSKVKDYILIYAKNIQKVNFGRIPLSETAKKEYQYRDERGIYARRPCIDAVRGRHTFDIKLPNGNVLHDHWMMAKQQFEEADQAGLIHWPQNGGNPMRKIYLSDALKSGQIANDFWGSEFGNNKNAAEEIKSLFGERVFDFPKPSLLLKNLLGLGMPSEEGVVLDFFSGSATTAHAVMQLNAEDGGSRKFIMVQLPEVTSETSEARKAGYETICDIGEERIRRAGDKIRAETEADIDYGFRVFRVDSSNMKEVYYAPDQADQLSLDDLTSNIKEDRTAEDLLFQVMLDLGILLSSSIEETVIAGKKVFSVASGYLLACFDRDVTEETVTEIAKRRPFYAVFRDSGMADDSIIANFDQIFAALSPATDRRVL